MISLINQNFSPIHQQVKVRCLISISLIEQGGHLFRKQEKENVK